LWQSKIKLWNPKEWWKWGEELDRLREQPDLKFSDVIINPWFQLGVLLIPVAATVSIFVALYIILPSIPYLSVGIWLVVLWTFFILLAIDHAWKVIYTEADSQREEILDTLDLLEITYAGKNKAAVDEAEDVFLRLKTEGRVPEIREFAEKGLKVVDLVEDYLALKKTAGASLGDDVDEASKAELDREAKGEIEKVPVPVSRKRIRNLWIAAFVATVIFIGFAIVLNFIPPQTRYFVDSRAVKAPSPSNISLVVNPPTKTRGNPVLELKIKNDAGATPWETPIDKRVSGRRNMFIVGTDEMPKTKDQKELMRYWLLKILEDRKKFGERFPTRTDTLVSFDQEYRRVLKTYLNLLRERAITEGDIEDLIKILELYNQIDPYVRKDTARSHKWDDEVHQPVSDIKTDIGNFLGKEWSPALNLRVNRIVNPITTWLSLLTYALALPSFLFFVALDAIQGRRAVSHVKGKGYQRGDYPILFMSVRDLVEEGDWNKWSLTSMIYLISFLSPIILALIGVIPFSVGFFVVPIPLVTFYFAYHLLKTDSSYWSRNGIIALNWLLKYGNLLVSEHDFSEWDWKTMQHTMPRKAPYAIVVFLDSPDTKKNIKDLNHKERSDFAAALEKHISEIMHEGKRQEAEELLSYTRSLIQEAPRPPDEPITAASLGEALPGVSKERFDELVESARSMMAAETDEALAEAVEKFDQLLNSASLSAPSPFRTTSEDELKEVVTKLQKIVLGPVLKQVALTPKEAIERLKEGKKMLSFVSLPMTLTQLKQIINSNAERGLDILKDLEGNAYLYLMRGSETYEDRWSGLPLPAQTESLLEPFDIDGHSHPKDSSATPSHGDEERALLSNRSQFIVSLIHGGIEMTVRMANETDHRAAVDRQEMRQMLVQFGLLKPTRGASLGEGEIVSRSREIMIINRRGIHTAPSNRIFDTTLVIKKLLDISVYFQKDSESAKISPTQMGLIAMFLENGSTVMVYAESASQSPEKLESILDLMDEMLKDEDFLERREIDVYIDKINGLIDKPEAGKSLGQAEVNELLDSVKTRRKPIFALWSYEDYKNLTPAQLDEIKKLALWYPKTLKVRIYGVDDPDMLGTVDRIVFTDAMPDELKDEIGKNISINLSTSATDPKVDFAEADYEPTYFQYQTENSGLLGMALMHVQSDIPFYGLDQVGGFYVVMDEITRALVQNYLADLAFKIAA